MTRALSIVFSLVVASLLTYGVATAADGDQEHTIISEVVGCHDLNFAERIDSAVAANDAEAFRKLLLLGIGFGLCTNWEVGTKVRIEDTDPSMRYYCLVEFGSMDQCYWTWVTAIEK